MALPLPAEDGELVTLARGGSDDAFAALYERYFPGVFDFLTRLLRDRQEAADIAQDTFIKAFERLDSLENPDSFRSWLFTIAHRNGLNRIERSKRSVAMADVHISESEAAELGVIDLDRAGDPERSAEAQAAASLIWEAAAGLDPRTYAVMDLHVRQVLGSAEIADVLGISKSNAYAMVSRMKKSFSQTLSTYLLVRNGSVDCEALAAIVAESGGTDLTPELRKQVDRHAKSCDICEENRKVLFIPLRMFAALAAVPAPAGLKAAIWGSAASARTGAAGGTAARSTAAASSASSWIGANAGVLSATAVLVVALVVAGIAVVRNNSDGDSEVLSSGIATTSTVAVSTTPSSTIPDTTQGHVPPPTTSVPSSTTTSTMAPPSTVIPSTPVAVADSARLAEDTSLVIDVLANDSGYAAGTPRAQHPKSRQPRPMAQPGSPDRRSSTPRPPTTPARIDWPIRSATETASNTRPRSRSRSPPSTTFPSCPARAR
jgi:RNA polymerase sigma factor (sigma-70 family)